MNTELAVNPFGPQVDLVDTQFDVRKRLKDLREWSKEWEQDDRLLMERIHQLDENRPTFEQEGMQFASLRKRGSMKLVKRPLYISPDLVKEVGYDTLRESLVRQFATLSKEERLLWLTNFYFILTPDLCQLNDKIARVRSYRSLGQQRNFLLGGESGMGKTTYLNWYMSHFIPTVQVDRNHVPIIKIESPVNISSPKPLFTRMILECGRVVNNRDSEEKMLMKLVVYLQKCDVELIILDEIQHINAPRLRRRVLEISNLVPGIPIVCASCHPLRWVEEDEEIAGRWNDYFGLHQYTGERLSQLLSYVELLLPFTETSYLYLYEIKTDAKRGGIADGPARLIEQLTGGILRDIMILITDASRRAIERNEPCLSPSLLEETWRGIQTEQVEDFLQILNRTRCQ